MYVSEWFHSLIPYGSNYTSIKEEKYRSLINNC